jgi:PAS domain S-box-containing protein
VVNFVYDWIIMSNLTESQKLIKLTSREREIMSFVILGKSNKDIAKHFGISRRTVEVHRLHIMQKTGCNNLIELLEYSLLERKKLENELLQIEERYITLLDDLTEIICRFKIDGTILFVNSAYCKMFGISRASLIGKSWAPNAHHEDLSMINEKLLNLSPNNNIVIVENRIFDNSGNIRFMQFINRAFFDTNGNLTEIQSVGREIQLQNISQ